MDRKEHSLDAARLLLTSSSRGTFLMRSIRILSGLLTLTLSICAASAQTLDPAKLALGEVKPVKAFRGKYAPGDLKFVEALQAGEATSELRQRASVVEQDNRLYAVLHIEFDDAESCRDFDFEDATIITRFEQFADVFIPDDTSVLALVREVPGVRWVEVDRGGIVPPI
ncbi:MAG: hypothetical protein RIC55_13065, partial [Pirellulaceae bacterium]